MGIPLIIFTIATNKMRRVHHKRSTHFYAFTTTTTTSTEVGRNGGNPYTNGPGGYKSRELNLPMDWVNERSKGMTLNFYKVFPEQEVLFLQSHVMTYDLQTTTAYWWCKNFGDGHEYSRPSVRTRSRLLPSSGIPVVAGRQVATLAQLTSERAASSELLVALHRKH